MRILLAPLGSALLCAVLILGLHSTLDLASWYGPGGVKSITALAQGNPSWDWSTWFMACLLPFCKNDIILAARLSPFIGSILTVFSLSFLGEKLFQEAWIVGISAALYTPILWLGILIGGDSIAMGLSYLGLIFFYHSGLFLFSLPLFGLAFKIKSLALPTLSYIIAIRFRPKWIFLLTLFLLPIWINHIQSLWFLPKGITVLWSFIQISDSVFQLACASLILLLFRPPKSPAILLWLLSFLAMSYSSWYLGDKIRMRYLIPASLPFLLLLSGQLGYLTKRRPTIRVASFTLLWTLLIFDGLSFFHTWEGKFIQKEGIKQSILPKPPALFLSRYKKMRDLEHSDVSAVGAKSLHQLALHAPNGAAIIPLRDTRHYHLFAVLTLKNRPYNDLDPQYCCRPNENLSSCAIKVVQEMNQSGARLILPTEAGQRIPPRFQKWYGYLLKEAEVFPSFQKYDPWWYIMDATASLSKLPCSKPMH